MERLEVRNGVYYITRKVPFRDCHIDDAFKNEVFEFAYGMTFGKAGEHRDHRSGGQHRRKNGELFADTFQGKMAEFFLYHYLVGKGVKSTIPDLDLWNLGKWDSTDLVIKGFKINVKSTKSFGNLLLLETKDWDSNADYIPNSGTGNEHYDFFILTRINPFCSDLMKEQRLLYSESADRNSLKKLMTTPNWQFDIPGFITKNDLKKVIIERQIIPQNSLLMSRFTKMDAENIYIQAGCMKPISELIPLLKS